MVGGAILLVAAPVANACRANTSMMLADGVTSGPPGTSITIEGAAFANGPVTFRWGSTSGPVLATLMGPDPTLTVSVPASAGPGTYDIYAADDVGPIPYVSAAFTVTSPAGSATSGGADNGSAGSSSAGSSSAGSVSTSAFAGGTGALAAPPGQASSASASTVPPGGSVVPPAPTGVNHPAPSSEPAATPSPAASGVAVAANPGLVPAPTTFAFQGAPSVVRDQQSSPSVSTAAIPSGPARVTPPKQVAPSSPEATGSLHPPIPGAFAGLSPDPRSGAISVLASPSTARNASWGIQLWEWALGTGVLGLVAASLLSARRRAAHCVPGRPS